MNESAPPMVMITPNHPNTFMTRPLRIAILAPISWRVAPRQYGPRELIAGSLADGLVERGGYQVTLFATAGSTTKATLKAICPAPLREDPSLNPAVWEALHIAHCFEHANSFDIIHNFCGYLPLAFSQFILTPILTTIDAMSPSTLPVYQRSRRRSHLVSVADADRASELEYVATVHHGVEMSQFRIQELSEGYLLYFGDISRGRGVTEAMELARLVRRRLVIAGSIGDPKYFEESVKPQLSDLIEYIGPVGAEHRADVLSGAAVLVQLGEDPEPFSLPVIEAMACGTPVLSRPSGPVEDIILPGENGFLVDSPQAAAESLTRCLRLDRAAVRESVEKQFDRGQMLDAYAAVYRKILPEERRPGTTGRNGAKRVIVRQPAAESRVR